MEVSKINLCGGQTKIHGYYSVDKQASSDLALDLEQSLLPFANNSIEAVICISAINYFTRARGAEIIQEVHRVLQNGGIARFAVQDLKEIAHKYVEDDRDFFYQKHPTKPRDRFVGQTMGDKFNYFFNRELGNKYLYDYETLALLFKEAGFTKVEQKKYRESSLKNIEQIDNRPDQMFFLEAVK